MKTQNIFIAPMIAGLIGCAALFSAFAMKTGSSCEAQPGSVDSLTIASANLPQPMRVNVALPASYSVSGNNTSYPVLYLLNGHGGHCNSWGSIVPLDSIATAYDMIIVTPSGMNSWYFDSPRRPEMQMETFFTTELIPYIDANYRTIADREGRAITGLSMGGHGALWLAIRHQDLFSAAGSTSGGVDFTPFPGRWNLDDALGKRDDNPDLWKSSTVMSQLDRLEPGSLTIVTDCGTEDFFYKVNCQLDSALNSRGIHHTFITGPGAHNGAYWSKSIMPQLDIFNRTLSR